MASFCANCGSPLGATSAFCPGCGNPVGNRPTPATPPPPQASAYSAPIAPAPKSASAMKLVLVLLCVLVFLGAAVVGGVIYAAHRVKQAVVQKAAENGVDLNSITSSLPSTSDVRRNLPKVCDLLTKDEVSQMIGEPIDRAEPRDLSCVYYGPPGLTAKLAQDNVTNSIQRSRNPHTELSGSEVANSVEQTINSLGTQPGAIDSELPLLIISLDADGKAQMTAIAASKAIFGGIGRQAGEKGSGFGADIPGLGDKAIRIPKLGLNVLKGTTLIRVIAGPFPDPDEKTIALVRAILPKL